MTSPGETSEARCAAVFDGMGFRAGTMLETGTAANVGRADRGVSELFGAPANGADDSGADSSGPEVDSLFDSPIDEQREASHPERSMLTQLVQTMSRSTRRSPFQMSLPNRIGTSRPGSVTRFFTVPNIVANS